MAASLPHGDPDPGKSPEAGLTRLLAMCDEAKALASLDWATHGNLDSKAALQAVEQLSRSIAAIQAGVLAGAQASGMWALDGQRNFDSWVTSHTGTTRGTAGRAVKLSNTLQEDLPGTRRALATGDISTAHAQTIARKCAASAKQKEKLADPRRGEAYLLEKAKEMDAGQFAKVAAAWSIEVDPKTADRQWRRQSATQEFSLVPTEEGYVASGSFTLVSGALLKEALAAHMGRKAKDDQRSFTERQADAMVALAGQSLDAGIQMPTARVRPHLIVTMEYDTIERLIDASGPLIPEAFGRGEAAAGEPPGCANEADWAEAWRPGQDHTISTALDYSALEGVKPARLADGSPLPHGVLARLACNSLFSRVIFGPQSVVLNAGREQRIFTAGQ